VDKTKPHRNVDVMELVTIPIQYVFKAARKSQNVCVKKDLLGMEIMIVLEKVDVLNKFKKINFNLKFNYLTNKCPKYLFNFLKKLKVTKIFFYFLFIN